MSITTRHNILSDIEDLYKRTANDNLKKISSNDTTIKFLKELCDIVDSNYTDKLIKLEMQLLRRKYHHSPNKTQLSATYSHLLANKTISSNETVRLYIKAKEMRGLSGVIVISVITSPYPEYTDADGNKKVQRFSCRHDCHYCPRELDKDGQEVNARSYLSAEPTVARGLRFKYDPIGQYNDRARQYHVNGHYVDKIEIIVLGGTWTEYPRDYQKHYIRDIFYAANTFYSKDHRGKFSLEQEQEINESAKSRIIGLTLEMRPDSIDEETVKWLRYLGCTRVQLGVQHIDDAILKKVNRGCYRADTERALKILKDFGYKVDAHWMPDLPGSSPEIDTKMFDEILSNEWLQFDQWKIYPTAVVPWTRIKKWYDSGTYMPYTEKSPEDLIKLLITVKKKVPEWIRINRVVRDIPNTTMKGEIYIYAGNKVPNLRQIIEQRMHRNDEYCKCIRCREPGKKTDMFEHAVTIVRDYYASGGHEFFISIESGSSINSRWDCKKKQWTLYNKQEPGIIYGFIRLRLLQNKSGEKYTNGTQYFPNIQDTSFIRELHVYGQVETVRHHDVSKGTVRHTDVQHRGIGKALLSVAEKIAHSHNYKKLAIISGIGVKNYYRRLGYKEIDTYMVKNIETTLLLPFYLAPVIAMMGVVIMGVAVAMMAPVITRFIM